MYEERSQKGLLELIAMIQYRVSFYGIFTLRDELGLANKKTKKIRNQLRLERIERKQEHNDLKKLVETQKKMIQTMAEKLNLGNLVTDIDNESK